MHHIVLVLLLAGPPPGEVTLAAEHDRPAVIAPSRTGKERLTDKASDEQRVNDCKVPPQRRTHARPTDCGLR
jgi:hypothetical protein